MKTFPYCLTYLSLLFWGCSPKEFHLPENPYAKWAKESSGLQSDSLPKPKGEWSERIFPLDSKRLNTLIEINQIDGIGDIPSGTKELNSWKQKLFKIQSTYPKELNQLTNELLYGVYFVTNLGSTGLTGVVRDKSGKPVGGIIYLDSELLKDGGNDWATKRENTTFQPHPSYSIHIQLDNSNSVESTLSYIVLHELGHILAIVRGHAPDYSEQTRDFRKFPLFEGVWWSETYSPYEDSFFPERNKIKFYQKNPSIALFPDGKFLYKKLTNTQFVSLYAATNADDTFAEAFAQYVHVFVLNKDYKVFFKSKDNTEVILSNPIQKEGGRKFRDLFEVMFAKNL
ncbi:hypothetical protein AB3N60_04460 [Leptospira sp. WS39.C2]